MMRSRWIALVVALAFSVPAPAEEKPAAEESKVEVGKKAPELTLKNHKGEEFKLADFLKKEKKNVLIAFYPKDFTGG